ncbi:cytidylyltransferase domain-containing protein [Pseudorhodoplanes sp.]|uniref:cytidylyltransferase domain-containing protein n=1 Tax=Pseudorhodoplanes sp. TaxID=1934341 RepID=UPI00391B73B1
MPEDWHPAVAIVQTRMTSSRLPGKVMRPLAGAPLIRRMIERVQRIAGLDRVVVALAEGEAHDPVIAALDGLDVTIVRGSEDDVLARYAVAARETDATTVMRVTSDCPLLDPEVSSTILRAYTDARPSGIRYARTSANSGYPHGFDTEVFDVAALFEADAKASDRFDREHVTPYIRNRPDAFPAVIIDSKPDRRNWRITVDTETDYRLTCAIYDALYRHNPHFGYADIVALFEARPDLRAIAEQTSAHVHAATR